MNDFIAIIQSVGFPIAVAVAMFIMLQNEQKEHKIETEKITETLYRLESSFKTSIHEQQKKSIAEAINNNTIVIQKLIDKFEKEGF